MSGYWTPEKIAQQVAANAEAEHRIQQTNPDVVENVLRAMSERNREHEIVIKIALLENLKKPIEGLPPLLQVSSANLIQTLTKHWLDIIQRFDLIWTPQLRQVYNQYTAELNYEVQEIIEDILGYDDEMDMSMIGVDGYTGFSDEDDEEFYDEDDEELYDNLDHADEDGDGQHHDTVEENEHDEMSPHEYDSDDYMEEDSNEDAQVSHHESPDADKNEVNAIVPQRGPMARASRPS